MGRVPFLLVPAVNNGTESARQFGSRMSAQLVQDELEPLNRGYRLNLFRFASLGWDAVINSILQFVLQMLPIWERRGSRNAE